MLAINAQADNSWFKSEPSNKLTAKQAIEAAKADKTVFRCELTEMNQNTAKPRKVKGAKPTLHSSIPESEVDATALLDGRAYKCQEVEFSKDSGSFKRI